MYGISSGNDPNGPKLTFSLWQVKGSWRSREGSPVVKIYRNTERKDGGYYVEFSYDKETVYNLPIKSYWGDLYYFDLYGLVGLAYDADSDTLHLSHYGEYYRAQ